MPKFKTGDKIALAKVEYRTVLEVVEASEHEYYIKRPYRPFESSVLSHSVVDIDNAYELVKPRESEPEISTVVDPDGFDMDDPESPINAFAQLRQKVDALVGLVERAYREGWEEAAPKNPHVDSFRVDKDWDNSYAKDELADIKEMKV